MVLVTASSASATTSPAIASETATPVVTGSSMPPTGSIADPVEFVSVSSILSRRRLKLYHPLRLRRKLFHLRTSPVRPDRQRARATPSGSR